MKDSTVAERLQRVRQMADNNLTKMDKVLPDRGSTDKLYTYLPGALQQAQRDPQFAAQLTEALEKYNTLHGMFWGKVKK